MKRSVAEELAALSVVRRLRVAAAERAVGRASSALSAARSTARETRAEHLDRQAHLTAVLSGRRDLYLSRSSLAADGLRALMTRERDAREAVDAGRDRRIDAISRHRAARDGLAHAMHERARAVRAELKVEEARRMLGPASSRNDDVTE